VSVNTGQAIDQAVLCGGSGFLQVLLFSRQFSFQLLKIHHQSSRANKISQGVADVPKRFSQAIPKRKKSVNG
jgi:hypothetical protein